MPKKQSLFMALFLIGIGIICRVLPHPWNATPTTAIILFASAYLGLRYSFLSLLVLMGVSDFFLGTYQWQMMLSVYVSFGLIGVIGLFVQKQKTTLRVLAGALSSSLLFFLVTNWVVWQFGTMYAHSFSGLLDSYTMGIPFFKNTLLGDLFYTGAFFGIYESVRYFYSKKYLIKNTRQEVRRV